MIGRTGRWILITAAIAAAATGIVSPSRVAAQSLPQTVEAINKSRVATRILYVTAHPDDETAGLLAYFSRGLDADLALLTVTRGRADRMRSVPNRTARSEWSAQRNF